MSNAMQKPNAREEFERMLESPAGNIDNVRDALKAFQRSIEARLPPGSVSVARMCSGLLNEVQRNPKLLRCTTISLVGFVLQASQFGLEIGSLLGQCYPVPYKNKSGVQEAQFQLGYRGYLTLASRCGAIRSLTATAVHENDATDIDQGTAKTVRHSPALKDRGPFIGVYGILEYTSGARQIHWMTVDQLEAFKTRYCRASDSPWHDKPFGFIEMSRKTVIRNLAKACPVSLELVQAANLDIIAEETDEPQMLASNVNLDEEEEAGPEAVQDRKPQLPTSPPTEKRGDKVRQQVFGNNQTDPKDRAESR